MKTKKIRRTILTIAILAVGYLGGRNNVLQNVFPTTVATEQPAKQTPPVSPDYQAIADQDFKSGAAAYLPINNDQSQLTATDWQGEKIVYGQLDQLNRTTSVTAYLSKRNLGKSEGRTRQIWNPTG